MRLWHVYAAIGLVALLLTIPQAWGYFAHGVTGVTVDFWRDALRGSDASRFLAYDVALLATACFILLWVEGGRLGIGIWWRVGYIMGSTLIAGSAFIPFFLAHRQRILDERG